jgi:peptidoglycan/LPS O-acetylase OafA/YrhL
MQEFRPAASGMVFGQAWSLGIEEKFYLLWPLLTAFLFPFKRHWTILALAIGAAWLLLPSLTPLWGTHQLWQPFLGLIACYRAR